MKESEVQKKILNHLKLKGHYAIKTVVTNSSGTPDIVACIEGKFLGLEVKAPGKEKEVSSLQKFHLSEIIKSGGHGFVVSDLDDVEEILLMILGEDNGN